jgi:hypothetical protein
MGKSRRGKREMDIGAEKSATISRLRNRQRTPAGVKKIRPGPEIFPIAENKV